MWVFKRKLCVDDSVECYKARLVEKGFTQIARVDYIDNFSSIAKLIQVHVFFSLAASHSWPL